MKIARYEMKIKDDSEAEAILNEIDTFFMELEHKHPELKVST